MATQMPEFTPVFQPEFEVDVDEGGVYGDVARPLSQWEKISQNPAIRRVSILLVFILIWQIFSSMADNPLLFPTVDETAVALYEGVFSGIIPKKLMTSMSVLLIAYTSAIIGAGLLAMMAATSRIGADILATLAGMLNPLPALALLPLALLWLGLGVTSIVVVIVQSVIWTASMNTYVGFQSVPETLRMAGRNMGLSGPRYVGKILIPAAFPFILTGMRIGWAHSWRTLIGAELVFGVAARDGGIGWFIYESRAQLETASVFAGLLVVILIGYLVENYFFRFIEDRTVKRWGMVGV